MAHKKRYRQNTAQKPLIGTKLRILKRAIDLFLTRDRYGASLPEIAYDSQVTVPSFYYYFGDKDELIAEMYKYLRDNHYREEESAGASISEVAKTWFPMIYYGRPYATVRKILRIAVREYRFDRRAAEAVTEVYRSTKARIAREVRVMIENGVIEPKYSPQHPILKHPQPMFLPQCQRPSFTSIQNNRQNYSSIYLNL